MQNKFQNILWDLDGTLTDPKIGILSCIQYALKKFGQTEPEMDELLWCIGPPLSETFSILFPGASQNEIALLISFYRERFGTVGMFENEIYSFSREILERSSLCYKNYLATSKPHFYAEQILKHFQIDQFFTKIHGSELNGERSQKADLIEYILQTNHLEASASIMIGDRKHDVIGAKSCGVFSVGVTWGYGSQKELADAQANQIISNPQELTEFLKCE